MGDKEVKEVEDDNQEEEKEEENDENKVIFRSHPGPCSRVCTC